MIKTLLDKLLNFNRRKLLLYLIIYFSWGMGMNFIGQELEIAKFTHWWQVITCYVLYMIPVSILVRGYNFFTQYAYGLVAMAVLEFGGYYFKTSYIYPGNIIETFFGEHVFALGMAIFFALYFPLGNLLIDWVDRVLFGGNRTE